MKYKILAILCLLFFSSTIVMQAQEVEETPTFLIGLFGGYNINIHSADFTELPGCPSCNPGFTTGIGGGISVGGLFEYPINPKMSAGLRFGYAGISGLLEKEEEIGNVHLYNPETGTSYTDVAVSRYSIDADLSLVGIEPNFIYKPIENLNLSAGIRLGFLMNNNRTQRETLVEPDESLFMEEGSKVRNEIVNQEIPEANTFHAHIALGAGYDLPAGEKLTLMPEIRYYHGLTDISSVSWKPNSIQAGIALKYAFYPKKEKEFIEEEQIIRDTTVKFIAGLKNREIELIAADTSYDNYEDEEIIRNTTIVRETYELRKPKQTSIEPALSIQGINADGTRVDNPQILIEEIESSELFPLLPYIFFNQNSANLDDSGLKQIEPDQTEDFSDKNLERDILGIYNQLLNIVGRRLQENKTATLDITGTNNGIDEEKGNKALSRKRAEAVKNYLVNTWGIEESRLTVGARNLPRFAANNDRPEGRVENRRVELYSSNREILKPIEIKDIEKNITPPQVEIIPTVTSDVPIKNWEYTITQGSDIIRTIPGKGNVEKQVWDIGIAPIPLTETNLEVKLKVTDEVGTEAEIEESINIEQLTIREKRYEMKDDHRIEKFSLILFDYDKAILKAQHKTVLNDIKSRIMPNSKVTIAGYADRTGTDEYNKQLAAKRTAVIKQYLGVGDEQAIIKNFGNEVLLYNNNSPEGRSYCRTVVITIVTPVKQ